MLKTLIIIIFLSTLIISCNKDDSLPTTGEDSYSDKKIPTFINFLKNEVRLVVGKGFSSGELIVNDAATGKAVDPCGKIKISIEGYPNLKQEHKVNDKSSGCELEILDSNPEEIINFFKATLDDQTVKVKFNGEVREMVFTLLGFANFKGSCNYGITSLGRVYVISGNCNILCGLVPGGCV
jgi:hypothetical protein